MLGTLFVELAWPTRTEAKSGVNLLVPGATPEMFFDARSTRFSQDGRRQFFNGNVVAIGVGTIIGADELWIDRDAGHFEAQGHIVVVSGTQAFAGDRLDYDLSTGNFSLSQAWMVANDAETSSRISNETLGVTAKELNFETHRRTRLGEIHARKDLLMVNYQEYIASGNIGEASHVAEAYAVLLQQKDLITLQENPYLARIPKDVRRSVKARRAFWKKSQSESATDNGSPIGYFRIEGETIKRIGDNAFQADEAFMTPCKCDANEDPAWAFQARRIDTKMGGYADLYDPVIMIKGIPVFYFPYLKVPVKGQRQSGFLFPNLTYSSRNGSVTTIPLFLAIDESSDATVTTDFFERRGLRLGLEYRSEQRRYSGWRVQFEGIRDRSWETIHLTRSRFINHYDNALTQARQTYSNRAQGNGSLDPSESQSLRKTLESPEWWESQASLAECLTAEDPSACRKHLIHDPIGPKSTPWRGQLEWQGASFLAPRLQLVSTGHILSDHRYLGDLFVPSADQTFNQVEPQLFTNAKWQVHLDGRQFYLGIGGRYGDYMLTNRRFVGLQMPFSLTYRSELTAVASDYLPFPVYSQISYDFKLLDGSRVADPPIGINAKSTYLSLKDGIWQRVRLRFVSPLVTDSVVMIDQFSDFEGRYVRPGIRIVTDHLPSTTDRLALLEGSDHPSSVRTWRTGLNFNLPIDGRMKLGEELSNSNNSQVTKYLEHRMNWGITLSVRPTVVSRGKYGHLDGLYTLVDGPDGEPANLHSNKIPLTYFDSDILKDFNNNIIDEKNSMMTHQKIVLKTSHDWFLFGTAWDRLPAQVPTKFSSSKGSQRSPADYRSRAKRELEANLDRAVLGVDQMIEGKDTWLVNRYRLVEHNKIHPVHFDATTSFDYIKEKRRIRLKGEGLDEISLPRPWDPIESNLSLNWASWGLGNHSKFDVYDHLFTVMAFGLAPPSFWNLSTVIGYKIDRTVTLNDFGGRNITNTRTREVTVSGELTKAIKWSVSYGLLNQVNDSGNETRTGKITGLYLSPSDCWGLKFEWEKPHSEPDWHKGNFFVGLSIKFFGHYRDYGNLMSRYNQHDA